MNEVSKLTQKNTFEVKGAKSMRWLPDQLEQCGFKKLNNRYFKTYSLLENTFELELTVEENRLSDRLVDLQTGEEYVLYKNESFQGEYINTIRQKINEIYQELYANCTSRYNLEITDELIGYIQEELKSPAEYLWKKDPYSCVFKREGKWFALLSRIPGNWIGSDEEFVEIFVIKAENVEKLIDYKTYFPAWHMNKKHWITLCLNNLDQVNEAKKRILKSYQSIYIKKASS